MRIKLGLLNVSFESLLHSDGGNLPVTSDTRNPIYRRRFGGYQLTCMTDWRTSIKETKAYPTICIPTNNANWRLPKQESQWL